MKLLKLKLFAFIIAVGALTACADLGSEEEYCRYTTLASATEVTAPTTAIVNQPITFSVKINIGNNCGTFAAFNATSGFPKEIGAAVAYDGCSCPVVENIITEEYKFTPTQVGDFTFKFLSTNGFITKTVSVTQ